MPKFSLLTISNPHHPTDIPISKEKFTENKTSIKEKESTHFLPISPLMETRSAKKRRLLISRENESNHSDDNTKNVDRISDLPDAVLHQILFLVPITTIAQTSVLSKRWRSLWSTFPDLDFTTLNPISIHANPNPKLIYPNYDYNNSDNPSKLRSFASKKSMDFITQILNLRDKNSDLRILRFRSRLTFSRLNGLIRSAIKHNVQELDIEVATDDYFNFPRCVISSESLRVFKLKSCYPGFRLPPSSVMNGGLKSLHSLSLSLIILYNQPSLSNMFSDTSFPLLKKLNLDACFGLKYLSVSCRALEEITLENCFQLQCLDVSGSKLERLCIASCFDAYSEKSWVKIRGSRIRSLVWEHNAITDSISLENLTSLEEASVGFFALDEDMSLAKLQSVSSLLLGLSHARSLTFVSRCIEILSNNNYFAVYLHPFNGLTSLELQTDFKKNNIPGLAYLFGSSPTLHTLILKIVTDFKIERRQWNKDLWEISSSEEEKFWESQTEMLKSFLQHLKVVKIHGFLECEKEVSLAKFLLKYGKALQELTICTANCNYRDSLRRHKIRSQMMGFSRASSNAKIIFR